MRVQRNKVVIIGAGNVGSAVLYTLLNSQSIAELVIIDKNERKAYGEALDGSHTTSFTYSPNIQVRTGDYSDCADAGIIVMTAGGSIKAGETGDRLTLGRLNLHIMAEAMGEIKKYTKEAIIIVVSNPVDLVTYYAQNYFDYPKELIIGTGTMLDTARYRRILGENYEVDTKNVHGYILGEHGNSSFATWSLTNIAGIPIEKYAEKFEAFPLDKRAILKEVQEVGNEILHSKGYTNFGIARSVERLIQGMMSNELSVMPVSTTLNGEYGIYDVAISIPCIITKDGVADKLEIPLNDEERAHLMASAEFLKGAIQRMIGPNGEIL